MAADTHENRTPLPGGWNEWVSALTDYKGFGRGLLKTFRGMDAEAEPTWTYLRRVLRWPPPYPAPILIKYYNQDFPHLFAGSINIASP